MDNVVFHEWMTRQLLNFDMSTPYIPKHLFHQRISYRASHPPPGINPRIESTETWGFPLFPNVVGIPLPAVSRWQSHSLFIGIQAPPLAIRVQSMLDSSLEWISAPYVFNVWTWVMESVIFDSRWMNPWCGASDVRLSRSQNSNERTRWGGHPKFSVELHHHGKCFCGVRVFTGWIKK